jgi:hypothetical protein
MRGSTGTWLAVAIGAGATFYLLSKYLANPEPWVTMPSPGWVTYNSATGQYGSELPAAQNQVQSLRGLRGGYGWRRF